MNDHRAAYIGVTLSVALFGAISLLIAQGQIPQIPHDYAWVGVLCGVVASTLSAFLPQWKTQEPHSLVVNVGEKPTVISASLSSEPPSFTTTTYFRPTPTPSPIIASIVPCSAAFLPPIPPPYSSGSLAFITPTHPDISP